MIFYMDSSIIFAYADSDLASIFLVTHYFTSSCRLFFLILQPPSSTLFPYTTLFRSTRPSSPPSPTPRPPRCWARSEEHTSELQSPCNIVCRLLLEKKKILVSVEQI